MENVVLRTKIGGEAGVGVAPGLIIKHRDDSPSHARLSCSLKRLARVGPRRRPKFRHCLLQASCAKGRVKHKRHEDRLAGLVHGD